LFVQSLLKPKHVDREPESIIVGKKLESAKQKDLALQGLYYNAPQDIYNSTNLYLPLSIMTYKEAKEVEQAASSANDLSLSFYNIFNVVFLDKEYHVIGKLLDKKASITDIHIPSGNYNSEIIDTTVKHIAYYIGFTDTNKDGLLNREDSHDLYLSDLSGKQLTQVTSGIDIENYYFQKDHSQLLIIYKERTNQREEHKRNKFAIYEISKKQFRKLEALEKQLESIEKQLIR
jgi:hypothetical protein